MNASADPKQAALLVAIAEASAWIALLHGPRRTAAAERGLQHWLAENPIHAKAFEHATETWNQTRGTVRRSAHVSISVPGDEPARRRVKGWHTEIAAAAVGLLVIAGSVYFAQRPTVSTGIGERRVVVLDDGTQVSLNTATRLVLRYSTQERRVQLESGEALFEVARHPDRPFVVTAGDRQILALGTSFLVRRDQRQLAVTLVEGKIAVSPDQVDRTQRAADDTVTLTPGQRLVLESHKPPKLDQPVVEKLTAWQQGLLNIDALTLAQAIAEMNRYSTEQLAVEGPAADIRVSGVFRLTDADNLARAVAMTHGLKLRREAHRVVIYGTPQTPSEARFNHDAPQSGTVP